MKNYFRWRAPRLPLGDNLTTTFAIFGITHQLLAWFFAWQIYLAPSPHGWTFVSVAVGTLIVAIGEMCGIFVLYHFNLLIMPWLLLIPLGFLLNAGIPMFVFQFAKKIIEDRRNNELETETHAASLE